MFFLGKKVPECYSVCLNVIALIYVCLIMICTLVLGLVLMLHLHLLAVVECKKPRRKGRDVKNKCAARGMVTIITSSCVITTDFALSITKIIKK